MPEGGQLDLRVQPRGKRVRVEVSDTGCGIPRDDQPYVFQTYFTTKSEGTGLGLAIVRRTIEDFGGKISFKSAPDVGTTFTITLPSVRQHQATVDRLLRELALQESVG